MNETTMTNLISPNDAAYDEARRVWNGTIDKRPAAIVRPRTAADVIEAVNYARARGLGVSIRGGGHHVAGSSLIEEGLVIDMALMRGVSVDAPAGRVRAEGGAQIGDVDAATQEHGLAVPLGLVSETGIAGLTLAGGFGWMRRKHGLSCDNLVSAEIVTADGRLLKASATENPDLYWALRGGGWDLGVVTSFEMQAHPLGPEIFLMFVTYPRAEGFQVLRRFRDYFQSAPPGMAPLAVCWTFPEAEIFPRELWGQQFVAVVGPYIGEVAEGERESVGLRSMGTVLTDMSGPVPWLEAQKFFDEDYPKGRRYYWKSSYLQSMPDEAIETLLALADSRPSPLTSVDIWPNGGAVAAVGENETPVGHRQSPFLIGIESNWDDPAADAANIGWAREATARLAPFSTGGTYLNFEDLSDAGTVAASHGANYQRLVQIKRKFDPENLFRSRRGLVD